MMADVIITRRVHDFISKKLLTRYTVWQNPYSSPITKTILLKRMKSCRGLLCMPYDVINSKIIDAAPNLSTISTFSVGYDHIDVKYAKSKGISIGYTPDVLSDATANMTLALMLDVTRGISHGDRIIRSSQWKFVYAPQQLCGIDISGKTLGILGMGRIGTLVAERARALGMKIAYHNRHRLATNIEEKIGAKYKSMRSLFSECDILSIHVPHTIDTHHLVNERIISMMHPRSFLINTSRGAVVDEKSLARAIKDGSIKGAGLDVFESEPLCTKNPLVKLDNVTLVPHLGSATKETRYAMARMALDNLLAGLAKKKIPHAVPYTD
ncbi:MAG: D-glycerate dehydrogenase [Cenarchaeum symbiont of Oopsacas minuta]|nr:D-glycerate dehydrogenase [Cenarchaeum symbiont of Oopsacas minuta]